MAETVAFQRKVPVIDPADALTATDIFIGGLVRVLLVRGAIDEADLLEMLEDIERGVADYTEPHGPGRPSTLEAVRELGRRWRRALAI
jgi:hypothetical protein